MQRHKEIDLLSERRILELKNTCLGDFNRFICQVMVFRNYAPRKIEICLYFVSSLNVLGMYASQQIFFG